MFRARHRHHHPLAPMTYRTRPRQRRLVRAVRALARARAPRDRPTPVPHDHWHSLRSRLVQAGWPRPRALRQDDRQSVRAAAPKNHRLPHRLRRRPGCTCPQSHREGAAHRGAMPATYPDHVSGLRAFAVGLRHGPEGDARTAANACRRRARTGIVVLAPAASTRVVELSELSGRYSPPQERELLVSRRGRSAPRDLYSVFEGRPRLTEGGPAEVRRDAFPPLSPRRRGDLADPPVVELLLAQLEVVEARSTSVFSPRIISSGTRSITRSYLSTNPRSDSARSCRRVSASCQMTTTSPAAAATFAVAVTTSAA